MSAESGAAALSARNTVKRLTTELYLLCLQAHECENLEFQAWDMITENFDAVSMTQEFLSLSPENLIEIIKYDDLQANEDEV